MGGTCFVDRFDVGVGPDFTASPTPWSAGTGGVSASVLQALNKLRGNPESVRGTADVG
jgi:hypothetical protein